MNRKPWYMNDNIIIFIMTAVMLSLVFSLIFYVEVMCQ